MDGRITFNQLAEIIPLGLVLGAPQVLEDDKGNLLEIAYPVLAISEAAMSKLEGQSQKAGPGLGGMLKTLWWQANYKPGDTKRLSLTGGLGIDLNMGIDGVIRLQLYRVQVYPGDNEWKTVINSLPHACEAFDLRRFEYKGKCYIQAKLLLLAEAEK